MTDTTKQIEQLKQALRWALEWIDAVPNDTVLPTMPGFDRDYVNELLAARATPVSPAPSEITPMFLLNAALCIEDAGVPQEKKAQVIAKLNRIAMELQEAKAAPAKSQPDLHSAIMNLPCNPPHLCTEATKFDYKRGHRDARHAAAELVAAAKDEPFGYLIDMGNALGEHFVKAADLAPEHGMRAEKVTPLFTTSVGAQVAGEPIHQYRITPTHPWTDCRDLHWPAAHGYETRTLYTAPVPAPAAVHRDSVIDECAQAVDVLGDAQFTGEKLEAAIACFDTIRALKGKAAPAPVAVAPVAGEGLTEQAAFDLAVQSGRSDQFDFRVPGTSEIHKVKCAVLEPSDALKFAHAILATQAERQPQPAAQAAECQGYLTECPTCKNVTSQCVGFDKLAAPAAVPQGVEARKCVKKMVANGATLLPASCPTCGLGACTLNVGAQGVEAMCGTCMGTGNHPRFTGNCDICDGAGKLGVEAQKGGADHG